jgi:uncharacterized protein YdeI (YjbR/CyaY-like superfamily)
LWFFQGALLKDEKRVLVNAQEGKTRAQRQWRMTSARDIRPAIVKSYVGEAIALARDGKSIAAMRNKPVTVPPELVKALRADPQAGEVFRDLKLGQRREYAEYVAEAKQDTTKHRRLEKILPMIKAGIGLNDRYR